MHPAWTVVLWVAFVLVVFIFGAQSEPPGLAPPCVNSDDDREHIRSIMHQAIDTAMKEQVQHLFDIWMRDGTGQPKRAVTGFANALAAYNGARAAVVKWQPPLCQGNQ